MNSKSENSKGFKEELTFFDLTNIIIGSIVGADIYIASALTAGLIGPFSIIIWVVAGIFASIIALVLLTVAIMFRKLGVLLLLFRMHLMIFMFSLPVGVCGLQKFWHYQFLP